MLWPLFPLYAGAFFPVVRRLFPCKIPTEQVLYYRNMGLYYRLVSTPLPPSPALGLRVVAYLVKPWFGRGRFRSAWTRHPQQSSFSWRTCGRRKGDKLTMSKDTPLGTCDRPPAYLRRLHRSSDECWGTFAGNLVNVTRGGSGECCNWFICVSDSGTFEGVGR